MAGRADVSLCDASVHCSDGIEPSGSAIGETDTALDCRFCFGVDGDDGVIVTFGVMYVGAGDTVEPPGVVVDVVACPTSSPGDEVSCVVDVVALFFVFVVLFIAELSFVVPASKDGDAFVAMTGATGMATNGTAVIAAKVHASATLVARAIGRVSASRR